MKASPDVMSILKELHKISGFRISVHDMDLQEIAAYPEEQSPFCAFIRKCGKREAICKEGDKNAFQIVNETGEVYIYRCKFGLWEAVSPLYHFGVQAGYLMMGQVIDDNPESRCMVFQKARPFVIHGCVLERKIDQIPVVAMDMIESYINIMTVCSEYITYSNQLRPQERDLAELTMKYIHRNYGQKFTIQDLCVYFRASKSTLINSFEERYHTTINRYLTEYRMSQAKIMLEQSDATIYEIAAKCGFSDQGYFSKVFQKEFGITPSAYRSGDTAEPAEGDQA